MRTIISESLNQYWERITKIIWLSFYGTQYGKKFRFMLINESLRASNILQSVQIELALLPNFNTDDTV